MAGLLNREIATADRPGDLMPDAISETLRRWSAEPFVWGKNDCALSVISHAERVTGQRQHSQFRYRGHIGARRLLRRSGGFPALFARIARQFGCDEVIAPERGDVGLVDVDGTGLTACLCLGEFWAARGDCEIVIFRGNALTAWRLPCPRP